MNSHSPKQIGALFFAGIVTLLSTTLNAAPERVLLWEKEAPVGDGSTEPSSAALTVHLAEKPNGAAVVICPGGGYGGLVTGAEGHGIAQWLNRHGIAGIVLEYRLPKGRAKVPLLDAQRALRMVRARAAEWKLNAGKVGIAGFSAGGHLASTAVTHFDAGEAASVESIDRMSCRPDFGVLIYPVISFVQSTHRGSMKNLLGPTPTSEMVDFYSTEKQVNAQTPPCFLAHAQDDKLVPAQNSALFYDALRTHGVPARYLELAGGGHGLNGYKGPMWDAWQMESLEWLSQQGIIPKTDAQSAVPQSNP